MTSSTAPKQPGMANYIEHKFNKEGDQEKGGVTEGVGINIVWQNGIIDEDNLQNGATVEDIIQCAIARLQHYQDGSLVCAANGLSIRHLEHAIQELNTRTEERTTRGVINTYEA